LALLGLQTNPFNPKAMHAGRHYTIVELLIWTRRELLLLFIWASIPTVLHAGLGWGWLAMPWVPIALVGTAAAFIVGFKNNATYGRAWEARQIYGAIVNTSRTFGVQVRDFIITAPTTGPQAGQDVAAIHRQLIYRHCAWLTALRFQLREPRSWENLERLYDPKFRSRYTIDERVSKLTDELPYYLTPAEIEYVLAKKNRATHLLSLQSKQLKELAEAGCIENFRYVELARQLADLYDQQGKAERIKNFPYPRQFATINLFFVRLFVLLMPFGMLQEFEKIGPTYVWLTIPFSVLVSWVFSTMEKIGEATENPFEGGPNDVPITALSCTIEVDLRELLDETNTPTPLQPVNNLLL
jgi:putative membrane protein